MKILFVVPYAPTPIRVRPYQLIRTLSKQGHNVTVATLWTTDEERVALAQLAQQCEQVLAHHLLRWRVIGNMAGVACTHLPYQSAFCWQPELAHGITSLLHNNSFDIVHVEHLRGARYGLAAKATLAAQQRMIPVIWDSVDCITHLFQQAARYSRSHLGRLMTHLDLARTRRYEGWLIRQFDHVLVTSATEKQALVELAQNGEGTNRKLHDRVLPQRDYTSDDSQCLDAHLTVIANGVDFDYFTPQSRLQSENNADIVFSGKMSYHANVTAALYLVQEIMPLVWSERPDVRVCIVGKDPPAEIRALESSSGDQKRVTVTGTVPDIRPFLQQATVAVAPILYGAGIQNKLLEAMACGTAVITSPLAATGLQAQARESLVVADSTDSFAASILHLLQDRAGRITLGQRGRRYVEEHHAWSNVAAQLEGIYQTTMAAKQRQLHANSL